MDYRTETTVHVPGRDDIVAASERIAPFVRRTPVLETEAGAFGIDLPLTLKLELLQVTGSFKPRGAFNRMLTAEVGGAGVVAASGGNFGLAVGYAARELGHRAEIFVPSTSPEAKIDRVRATGADLRVIEGLYDDASLAARDRLAETGAVWMHPYDQLEVVAAQGTIGRELSQQAPDAETVLVAVGGGGLVGGIAAWYAGDARVVAVEPATSACLRAAFDAGHPVEIDVEGIAVDSLGPRRAGDIAFEIARRHLDRVVTVSDDAIRDAQRAIWRELHLLAEPGGAATLAALMTGAYRPSDAERMVVLLCGANGDPAPVVD